MVHGLGMFWTCHLPRSIPLRSAPDMLHAVLCRSPSSRIARPNIQFSYPWPSSLSPLPFSRPLPFPLLSLPLSPLLPATHSLPIPLTNSLQVPNLGTLIAQPVIDALADPNGRRTLEAVVGRRAVGREQALRGAELDVFGEDVVAVAAAEEGVGVLAHLLLGGFCWEWGGCAVGVLKVGLWGCEVCEGGGGWLGWVGLGYLCNGKDGGGGGGSCGGGSYGGGCS